jgi:RHS repeat-associated protein
VTERSEYEPYGLLLNRALHDGPGYTGHVNDAATGLSYMQQRYYDPGIGRFLSVDPVTASGNSGANFNRYWYANNNPYRFTDPDGRCPTGTLICQRSLNIGRSVGPAGTGLAFRPLNFSTKPGVTISSESYSKVSKTADNYNDKTGKKLVVTDGVRTPQDQAAAMYYKITHGAGLGEYRNRIAANEIMGSYREAVSDGTNPVSAMASTIQGQMDRGIYISRHLSGTGADFRDRDISGQERSILRSSAFDAGATNVLKEGIPPHTHVEY